MNLSVWVLLTLGVLLFVSTGYAYFERESRIDLEGRLAASEESVKAKDKALGALQEEVRAARERVRRYERIRQDVAMAPDSRACADSPAIAAALRGLRAAEGGAGHSAGADRGAAPARTP